MQEPIPEKWSPPLCDLNAPEVISLTLKNLADVIESLTAVIYMDCGLHAAARFLERVGILP